MFETHDQHAELSAGLVQRRAGDTPLTSKLTGTLEPCKHNYLIGNTS